MLRPTVDAGARRALALIAAATAVLVGCSSPMGPDTILNPIQIETVDVRVLESFPPQASAHVKGWLGDGCTEFHSTKQERSGNVVTVTILSQRPRDAVCTMIAKGYEANVKLEGAFPPGQYVLRVNGVEKTFTTQ